MTSLYTDGVCATGKGTIMRLDELRKTVESHTGVFHCRSRGGSADTREVAFRHDFGEPTGAGAEMAVPALADFYDTFAWLRLYRDPQSGDAAFHIGTPDEWAVFDEGLRLWFEDLDDDERAELLPPWIDDCLVIGEIPMSGNYLMLPLSGPQKGHVFEFEHDGFEFIDLGDDLEQFVRRALAPDTGSLRAMASHLTFSRPGDSTQWWIEVMHDNLGNNVRTDA